MYFFFNGVVFVSLYILRLFTIVRVDQISDKDGKVKFFFFFLISVPVLRKDQTSFYSLTISSKDPRSCVIKFQRERFSVHIKRSANQFAQPMRTTATFIGYGRSGFTERPAYNLAIRFAV